MKNLFRKIPHPLLSEMTEALVKSSKVRVERILSHGHASPKGFWYDQDHPEWVVVLQGRAKLRFEDEDEPLEMRPGDHLSIPAHTRHRVDWTTPEEPTVWLAIHYDL